MLRSVTALCSIVLAFSAVASVPVVRSQGGRSAKDTIATKHDLTMPGAEQQRTLPSRKRESPAAGSTEPPLVSASAALPAKGTVTGLPLPRFAALRANKVNLRVGPGTRYPIEWVYMRRSLPVEIEREFDVWRLVQDADGIKGWVHQATLIGRRSFIVTGTQRVMRRSPNPQAAPVARLDAGVIGRLHRCEAASAWCQVQVGDYRGWLPRNAFWGALPNAIVND